MTTFHTEAVGKVWIPDYDAVVVGPATPAGRPKRQYAGIVSYIVREGGDPRKPTQRGWGIATPQFGGLTERWQASDTLQRLFRTPDDFIRAVRLRLFTGSELPVFGYAPNERVRNGARMLAKSFWGLSSAPQVATVNTPSYLALDNASSFTSGNFTWANNGQDLSLGSGGGGATGAGVTTNEFTTNGLARAASTVGSYADPSALDGVFTCTVTHTFTCSAANQTVYGSGLFDASSTATCNLFAEAPFTSATLQNSDTLAVTWNISS